MHPKIIWKGATEVIYLHVTLQTKRGKLNEWSSLYEKEYVPMLEKHGQRLVGAWKTTVGTYDEVTDLYAFENFTEFERIRGELFKDPKTAALINKIFPLAGLEVSKIMVPFDYSPLK